MTAHFPRILCYPSAHKTDVSSLAVRPSNRGSIPGCVHTDSCRMEPWAPGKKRPGVRLVSHCHLMPRLRNGGLWSLPPITTGCHGLVLNQ